MRTLAHLLLSLFLLPVATLAQDTATSKPSIKASRTLAVVAQVSDIDHAARVVELETEDGDSFEMSVSPDVRNLDQVQAGDFVIAQIFQEVDIQVKANPEGLAPGASAAAVAERAEAGAMPAGALGASVTVSALVTDIDLEANTFTLRGPAGNEMTFEAQNPDNLRRSEVGDLVVITVTESLGVLVERPAGD